MNAPTIEEQIICIRNLPENELRNAILASLEKLAALEKPVPVEPFRRFRGVLKPVDRGMWVNGPCDYYHDAEVDTRIDSLQSALKLAQEKAVDDCKLWRDRRDEALTALEKAEAINRRIVEQYRDLVAAAENHRCYKAQCGICEALAKLEEA